MALLAFMIGCLLAILPAAVIRFFYFRRGLNYGVEIYTHMIVSIVATLLIMFVFMNIVLATFGIMETIAVYCILSFRTSGVNSISRKHRYILTA